MSFNLTNEELSGVLKTIYLFLDGINFKKSSSALYEESACKGYGKFEVAPRNVVLHTSEKFANMKLHKSVQTFGLDDEDRSCQLQSSIHSETETKEGLLVYYKEPFDSYTMSSKELIINVDAPRNLSANVYRKKKSINISSINFVKNYPGQITKTDGTFYKSHSDPTLNLSTSDSNKQVLDTAQKEVIGCKYLKKKLRSLESDYKRLMGVTTELTGALQTHIMGQSENLNAMLNKCKCIYPELFQNETNIIEMAKKASSEEVACTNDCRDKISVLDTNDKLQNLPTKIETFVEEEIITSRPLDESKAPEENDNVTIIIEEEAQIHSNYSNSKKQETDSVCLCKSCCSASNVNPSETKDCELNYTKLKTDLINGNSERIIINSPKDVRHTIMNSYMRNDLLNVLCSDQENIAEKLFRSGNSKLQEETSRLINTIASLKLGREYLCQSEGFLITFLIPIVKGTYQPLLKLTSITEDMLIASVQKLSLKYRQREFMINAELTEYMVKFLSDKYLKVSRYCLEYATALFMNLCLHQTARERLRAYAKNVIELLAKLLNTKYEFCMPYVNGAIYSLLSDKCLNEEARRQKFFELIQYHITQTDGELRNELEHIIKVHLENTENLICTCDSTTEPEFEVDILEPELNDGENVIEKEDILLEYKQHGVKLQNIKCLGRPATPLERSAQKPVKLNKKKLANMSYSEETMQFYHIPSKTSIFDTQTKKTQKLESSLFSLPTKKTNNCNSNCICQCCIGKTIPYQPENSLVHSVPIAYNVPLCYRNNYEHFKMHSNCKENRYTCNCFQLVSEDVKYDSNTRNDNNRNTVNRYHFCPKCHKHHYLNESSICFRCNRKNDINSNVTNGGVVNFTYKELSESSDQIQPIVEEAPCYDRVFQSRPKILRTPP
ncbi:hypothetical protein RN001_006952 [Aquatica leii]|uniref:LisH domain-containing protein n=1 Tax=Aquatica leii TaxID=1421715 RepID=A0AAN7SQD8_9COLE|nr:hypothetical protein RN001_006952 [Aquatica leii]